MLVARALVRGTAPRGPLVREHQHTSDARHLPPALPCDVQRETALPIDPAEHRLQIRDHRLDLDDQQRAGAGMERQDVDRAALAANVLNETSVATSQSLAARISSVRSTRSA
jgi:hypothetical protein